MDKQHTAPHQVAKADQVPPSQLVDPSQLVPEVADQVPVHPDDATTKPAKAAKAGKKKAAGNARGKK